MEDLYTVNINRINHSDKHYLATACPIVFNYSKSGIVKIGGDRNLTRM
jgi:hypothetical protein